MTFGDTQKVAAVIVTYNRRELLRAALESVLQQTRPVDQLIVVDNASTDGTDTMLAENYPEATHIRMPTNTGSAGGCAAGMRAAYEAGHDWIWLLDDDNPPPRNDLLELLLTFAPQIQSEFSPLGGVAIAGQFFDWRSGTIKRVLDAELTNGGPLEVDVIGHNLCPLWSRHVVEKVGVPQAELFFGYQDIEYSLRIRRAGFKLLVPRKLMYANRQRLREQSRQLKLEEKGSFNDVDDTKLWRNYYTTRNYVYMMWQTFGCKRLAFLFLLKTLAKSVLITAYKPTFWLAYNRLILKGLIDGFTGRLGRRVTPPY